MIFVFSYLLGAIPFGFLIMRLVQKKDIRKIGSGNIGATNVLRSGYKFLAFLTLVLDFLKSYILVLYVQEHFPDLVFYTGFLCVIGHIFPIWLKFKGGKGVATAVGFICGIDWLLGLSLFLLWGLVFLVTKISSLAAILTICLLMSVCWFLYPLKDAFILFIMGGILIYRHTDNIKRLLSGQELTFKK